MTLRAYQINFSQSSFGNIGDFKVDTPVHPPENLSPDFCEMKPSPTPASCWIVAAGDILDLYAALSRRVRGYAEIGLNLAA